MKPLAMLMGLTLIATATAQEITVTRANAEPAKLAPAENFTGTARLERLVIGADPARFSCGLVHFETGARTNWHTHPLGQTLIVTAGVGRVDAHAVGPRRVGQDRHLARRHILVAHAHRTAIREDEGVVALRQRLAE